MVTINSKHLILEGIKSVQEDSCINAEAAALLFALEQCSARRMKIDTLYTDCSSLFQHVFRGDYRINWRMEKMIQDIENCLVDFYTNLWKTSSNFSCVDILNALPNDHSRMTIPSFLLRTEHFWSNQ